MLGRASLMDVSGQTFHLESAVLSVEDDPRAGDFSFGMSHSRSVVLGSWSPQHLETRAVFGLGGVGDVRPFTLGVLAGAWNVELQVVTDKNLVVSESWRSLVEADVFS